VPLPRDPRLTWAWCRIVVVRPAARSAGRGPQSETGFCRPSVIGTYALASAIKNNQAQPVRRAVAWYNVRGEVRDMKVLRRGRRALKPGKR
jgi:hypothetical protein